MEKVNYESKIKKVVNRMDKIAIINEKLNHERTYIGEHADTLLGSPKLTHIYYHIFYDILGGAEDKGIFHDGNNNPADVDSMDSFTTGTDACFADINSGKHILSGIGIIDDPKDVKNAKAKMEKLAPKHALDALYNYYEAHNHIIIQLASPMTVNILLTWAEIDTDNILDNLNSYVIDMKNYVKSHHETTSVKD